jgi:Protein of unknown function (DUF3300)
MKSSIKYVLTLSLLIPLVGCTTSQAEPQSRVYEADQSVAFSQQQLDSLLAPIALYPDSLLSHVLIASTYPLEVVDADRWIQNNSRLSGDAAVNAADSKDWDPSVKALVAFPDVLKRMSEDLNWTQQLGDAFLEDEGRVMDSIQNLRDKAYAAGNLQNTDHVKVVREDRVIMIEPAVERVVYVPVYDTRVVYGPWWWADYPPVYWHRYSNQVYFSGSFYWGPRVYIGPSFHFSSCHWHNRRVVVIDHHHHSDYYHHRHAYTGRHLAHYEGARHWNHNPVHRRGVAYYNEPVRNRYQSNREPRRNAWDERQQARERAGVYSKNPDRERQANRFNNRDSRNNDASGINRGNDPRNNSVRNNQSPAENRQQVFENRSDAVRARLAERQNQNRDTSPAAGRNIRTENASQVDRNNRWNTGREVQSNQTNARQNNSPSRFETRQQEPRIVREPMQMTREPSAQDNSRFSRRESTDNREAPRQIIRNNDRSDSNSRFERPQRETRMEQRNESRMESRRSGSEEGGRRVNRE